MQWWINDIETVAHNYWNQPDVDGLKIVLAFVGAYQLNERFPFWLHIVGGPSSGKTELGFSPVEHVGKDFLQVDNLTTKTFMSGYTSGDNDGKNNSLLHRIGSKGLLSMGDFTSLMEKPEPIVREIAGQLRRIFDGSFSNQTGVENDNAMWFGRLSIITAMTPKAFHLWTTLNEMGERFLTLRWRTPVGANPDQHVIRQAQAEADFDKTKFQPRNLITHLIKTNLYGSEIQSPWPEQLAPRAQALNLVPLRDVKKPDIPIDLIQNSGNNIFRMAEVTAKMRTHVTYEKNDKIGIIEMGEQPGRIQHQLLKAVRGYAYMLRREVQTEDLAIARRLSLDSIPFARAAALAVLLSNDHTRFKELGDIRTQARFHDLAPLEKTMKDLHVLGVVQPASSQLTGAEARYRLHPDFTSLYREAYGL